MRNNDKLIRKLAFYISLVLFLALFPVVMSYSLGYKIDYKSFIIYKTGIIYLGSTPAGASIYINGKLHYDITPARVEELKPGTYKVEVRRDGFYSWQKDLVVKPNMVTRADDIVLFPVTQNIDAVGDQDADDFAVSDRNNVYYFSRKGLYRSNLDGTNTKRLSAYSDWPIDVIGKKFSPDGEKMMYFNQNSIWVISLNAGKDIAKNQEIARVNEVIKSSSQILDAFWYSTSGYIVFITPFDIKVAELGAGEKNVVTLYKFRKRPQSFYYDKNSDSLYFSDMLDDSKAYMDSKGIERRKGGVYVHRLDLRQKFFYQLMERFKKEFDIRDVKSDEAK